MIRCIYWCRQQESNPATLRLRPTPEYPAFLLVAGYQADEPAQ